MQDNEKKRLYVDIEQGTYDGLTQMVNKYKIPMSEILNEILKTSQDHEQFMRQLDFNLRILQILIGNGNQSAISKTKKETIDNGNNNQ